MLCFSIVSGCSSDGKPVKTASSVEDPVSIQVQGVANQALLDNIYAHLASTPVISKKKARLYRQEILDKITVASHSFGYYHPTATFNFPARDSDSKVIEVKVDPGKALFIRDCQIEIIGEGAMYYSFQDIIRESGITSYSMLNHGKYEKLKEDLKTRALSLGFFDARIVSSTILVYQEQNAADIILIYDTGRRYRFGQMVMNDETREIMTPSQPLVNFQEGDYFSSSVLGSFSSSLSSTGYYRSIDVSAAVEGRKDGFVPVKVDLGKKPKNMYRLGVGFSSDEGPRGILGWDKPYINSSGHSFASHIRSSAVKNVARIMYKIPRDNPNLDYFYFNIAQSRIDLRDTLSDVSHISFHYVNNTHKLLRLDTYVAAEYEDYEQADEKGHAFNAMLGLQLAMRSTTGGLYPRAGYSLVWDNRLATRALSDSNFWLTELVFKALISPTENTRFIYKFMQGATVGSDSYHVPPSMRFFIGGERTIRGFGYKAESSRNSSGDLTGSRFYTAVSAELEFPSGINNCKGAVFLDSAVVTNDYTKERHLLLGPGIGVRYITDYGIAKIDIAYGINNAEDDRHVKLHLQFGPEF